MEEKFNIEPIVETEVVEKPKAKQKQKQSFRIKECKVKRYVKHDNAIEIDFDGFGLRFDNLKKDYTGVKTVKVQYKGAIGKPKFVCQINE